MKIGIVGAMEVEITFVLDKLTDIETIQKNTFTFYQGKYLTHDIVLVRSGVGKVMASMLATTLLEHFAVERFINIGVAGGIAGKTRANDCLLIDSALFSDVDVTSVNTYQYGELPGFPREFQLDTFDLALAGFDFSIIRGSILTGDQFVSDARKLQQLIKIHYKDVNICAVDMETAAFAQVAHVFQIPFMAIRAISDVIGSDQKEDAYAFNLIQACTHSGMVVLEYLKELRG